MKRVKAVVELGDLIVAACDRAARQARDAQEMAQRAAVATVQALLRSGNLETLIRLAQAEKAYS